MSTSTAAPAFRETIAPEWRTWGPYLSERQWGTVREDYSATGEAWDSFPHDQARSRAYRWGEDGILGISDNTQQLCFAIALWNGNDPILKERMFGLTGSEGNHGEDVKEYYYYLDATPTHSYLRGLYKYPQRAYPYQDLVAENRRRGREEMEYELLETGVFDEDRYFDVEVEYAKVGPSDILIRIKATNLGPDTAPLHLLPTLWFRNTWSWGDDVPRPELRAVADRQPTGSEEVVEASHPDLGNFWLVCQGSPDLLFTENESNARRLWGSPNRTPFVKDGINDAIVSGNSDATNPARIGTKMSAHYNLEIAPGQSETVVLRLSNTRVDSPLTDTEQTFATRITEADSLYAAIGRGRLTEDEALVQRQALAGLIWSKQVYNYDVSRWLDGDPDNPSPPEARKHGRNSEWRHHVSCEVISMPDKWEYPWYAAWDLAFHTVAFDLIDRRFAKDQLLLMLRDRYMHSSGQMPAYEWAFGDVNPPVHIAATRAIYQREREETGSGDREFLARIFHKLLINFTWWVNRKDEDGNNLFQGGFLGLDNIGVIDRTSGLPANLTLEQSDGTAWMASYCLNMAWAAIELSMREPMYEDLATKFVEHYLVIGGAMNGLGDDVAGLWDDEDGFFYDYVHHSDGRRMPLKVRSLVGLLPIFPAIGLTASDRSRLQENAPSFSRELHWYLARHPEVASLFRERDLEDGERRLVLTLVPEDRLRRILARMFDPEEFLSDYGIRAISRTYLEHPFELQARGQVLTVKYEPAESSSGMFGGNSNWRGPIWMPMNLLLVQGLHNLHRCYGDDFLVEYPTGSGDFLPLNKIADDLSRRLVSIFLRDADGRRPVFGGTSVMQDDPRWRDHLLFYEYFHGDNGAGIGASHQTGWTAIVANLIDHAPEGDLEPDTV